MQPPKGQDVVLPDDVPLAGWRSGPLPDPALEAIARKLFERQWPMIEWTSNLFREEQDDARGFALQLAIDFAKRDQWTLSTAAERLTDSFTHLVFGERRLGQTIRGEVAAFAAATIGDLAVAFRNRLFYARDIDANQRELEEEANRENH